MQKFLNSVHEPLNSVQKKKYLNGVEKYLNSVHKHLNRCKVRTLGLMWPSATLPMAHWRPVGVFSVGGVEAPGRPLLDEIPYRYQAGAWRGRCVTISRQYCFPEAPTGLFSYARWRDTFYASSGGALRI